MRTVKWCLSFGVVLAGVVIGYCRPCHESDVAPVPSMLTSFDEGCCEEGCGCCKQPANGTGNYFDLGKDQFIERMIPPTQEVLDAMQAAEAGKAPKLVR
jgi:hypothetical protein